MGCAEGARAEGWEVECCTTSMTTFLCFHIKGSEIWCVLVRTVHSCFSKQVICVSSDMTEFYNQGYVAQQLEFLSRSTQGSRINTLHLLSNGLVGLIHLLD